MAELRRSPLPPRATEIAFADRFSFAVIDADAYLALDRDAETARDFYNDTYLSDQNACTSPRLVVWTGANRAAAKERFWRALHALVLESYAFQPIQSVDKLTAACLAAAVEGARLEEHPDNSLVRLRVPVLSPELIELRGDSGFFFEYDCDDLTELRELCSDGRCQTLSYIGNREMFLPLLRSGVRGVDRVVPVGRTMDFELLWDGYDLSERLTRTVRVI